MKVRLTMDFELPEHYYRDDKEDQNIDPNKLGGHHLSFIRDEIFRSFINYSKCCHLADAMDWMVSDSANKQEHVDYHREWVRILDESEKTMKMEIPFNFKDFKKEFDERLAKITDQELIQQFADLGWGVNKLNDEETDTSILA